VVSLYTSTAVLRSAADRRIGETTKLESTANTMIEHSLERNTWYLSCLLGYQGQLPNLVDNYVEVATDTSHIHHCIQVHITPFRVTSRSTEALPANPSAPNIKFPARSQDSLFNSFAAIKMELKRSPRKIERRIYLHHVFPVPTMGARAILRYQKNEH
jgi:hypothetical protein